MVDNVSLMDLAGRCEAASGRDRELNKLCAVVAGWQKSGKVWFGGATEQGWQKPGHQKGDDLSLSVPDFTASIDAAMTLVLEGSQWTLTTDGPRYLAHVNGFTASAATHALALCAAALRARAEDNPHV